MMQRTSILTPIGGYLKDVGGDELLTAEMGISLVTGNALSQGRFSVTIKPSGGCLFVLLEVALPTPSVTFAFMIATMLGAGFHLLVGGDVRRLALYLLAAWMGFALGQVTGSLLGIGILKVGVLRLLPAITGALLVMFGSHTLVVRPALRK